MVSVESLEAVIVATHRDKTATFLYQVVDEYGDHGYTTVGIGTESEYDAVRELADIHLAKRVDDRSITTVAEIEGPCCFVVLPWMNHDLVVKRVKLIREHSGDVFVRYFPHCDVTR